MLDVRGRIALKPTLVDSIQISGFLASIGISRYVRAAVSKHDQPPVIEPNRCNCAALRKASRRVSLLYDSALAPCGLKSTQFAMLSEIHRRADAAPTIRELAEALVMDQSTIGQNLRPLEREGLISLAQDEADRRSRRVKLTSVGRSRFAAARPLWSEAQQRFENGFGKRAAAELRSVLATVARDPSLAGESETLLP
jgi:DNA-binding MarR family transcriptional regulator